MKIAKEVLQVAEVLKQNHYQAYLVGGCLRDVLMGRVPKDWDIATDAKPDKIQALFPDSVYENTFGTVGVKTRSEDPTLKIIEITTFRLEGTYADKRHPDEVKFAKTIEEDLARRDFTVNAMALRLTDQLTNRPTELIDPFGGEQDVVDRIIRAVGEADRRFNEDALRLLRAVRFSAQLGFEIHAETLAAIKRHKGLLEFVSKERIRDETEKMLLSDRAHDGIQTLLDTGLLHYIFPELEEGVGMEQNEHHIYTVFDHNLKSLEYAVKKNYSLIVRLAALLHDVGKPKSRAWKSKETGKKVREEKFTRPALPSDRGGRGDWTFYGHQVIGARMTAAMLERLKFSRDIIEKVSLLVYEHMFIYDPEVVSLAGVRRLLSRVGSENISDLIKVREADRIGSGVPKAQPYRLRYLLAMLEKVKTDPISAKMLVVKGDDVIAALGAAPGPIIGKIIAVLLEEVLEDPSRNQKEYLLGRVKELGVLSEKKLEEMAAVSKKRAAHEQEKIDDEIKKKYFVK